MVCLLWLPSIVCSLNQTQENAEWNVIEHCINLYQLYQRNLSSMIFILHGIMAKICETVTRPPDHKYTIPGKHPSPTQVGKAPISCDFFQLIMKCDSTHPPVIKHGWLENTLFLLGDFSLETPIWNQFPACHVWFPAWEDYPAIPSSPCPSLKTSTPPLPTLNRLAHW